MPRLRPWIARYGQHERADIEEIPIADGQEINALDFVDTSSGEVVAAASGVAVDGLSLSGTSEYYPFPNRALVARLTGLWFAAAANRTPTEDDVGETAAVEKDEDDIWIVNLDGGGTHVLIKNVRDHEDTVEFEFLPAGDRSNPA